MRCAVFGCNNSNESKNRNGENRFFTFPKDKKTQIEWIRFCKRKDTVNVKWARICSDHFVNSDYIRSLQLDLLGYKPRHGPALKKGVVPSILPCQTIKSETGDRKEPLERKENNAVLDKFISNVNTDSMSDSRDEVIRSLRKQVQLLEKRQEVFRNFFSDAQCLKLEGKRVLKWSVDDISKALVIYSAGPRCYRQLLKTKYPLPAISTLRSWLSKLKIAPGILKNIFNIMKATELSAIDKVCVISFDKMKIRQSFAYDKVNDQTLKPSNYVQVVMLRGLFKSWKQPVFYNYDCKMTKKILFNIIEYAESSGFQIVAIVSDLGGDNRGLYKELNIDYNNTFFKNPANDENIYVFADVPHLLKLIRNNFIDYGFMINQKEINKSIVEDILQITSSSDLNISYKIFQESINVQGVARQKVEHAAKLFSHTISKAISRCGTLGLLKESDWLECAEFFKIVNDWFEVLNVKVPATNSQARMQPYGINTEIQNNILDKMSDTIRHLKVKGKPFLLPFQKGILMTNSSVKLLLQDIKNRFSIMEHILTHRLNQDVFEHFFGVLRAKDGLHDHPDALEFKNRLQSYILGRHEAAYSTYGNVEGDATPNIELDSDLCGPILASIPFQDIQHNDDAMDRELSDVEYDGLEQLSGYICYKLKEENSSDTSAYTWTSHLSKTGLTYPSNDFMNQMRELEKNFQQINKDSVLVTKNYLKKLMDVSSHISCPDKAKMLFFKSRMYFRIKDLNRNLNDSFKSKKRKMSKIVT